MPESTDTIKTPESDYGVTIQPHPFSQRQTTRRLPQGGTVADMLKACDLIGDNLHVFLDDVRVPPGQWNVVKPAADATVAVRVVPAGGGGGGGGGGDKDIMRAVAVIAVIAAAPYLGPMVGSAIFATEAAWAGAMGTALVGIGGSLMINALSPPPTLPGTAGVPASSAAAGRSAFYAVTGVRNQTLAFKPVPRTFGKDRVYPPLAAQPWTQIIGQDQYLNMLFCLGRGPLTVTDVKIGETLLSDYNPDTCELDYGTGANPPAFFDHRTVKQQTLNIKLPSYEIIDLYPHHTHTAWTVQTTEPDADRAGIELYIPSFVFVRSDGKKGLVYTDIEIEYAVAGSGNWQPVTVTRARSGLGWHSGTNRFTIADSDGAAFRAGFEIVFPSRNQYDVRMKRVVSWTNPNVTPHPYSTGGQKYLNDDVFWVALRTITTVPAIDAPEDMEFVSLRIQASEKLTGVIDTFNCIIQAHHPIYNGATWSHGPTSNPAWIYAGILTGSHNHKALPPARLDADNLLAWAGFCDTHGYAFNYTAPGSNSVGEMLRLCAAAGRAAPSTSDGRHGVVVDKVIPDTEVKQVFSPRNSWGYQGVKIFADRPHALKVRYRDAAAGYVWNEAVAYDDGYSAGNATQYETIEYQGITRHAHAMRRAVYDLAVSRLRPETHTLNVDFEHMVCTRGDRVALVHDVPLFGVSVGARIKNITIAADLVTLELDDLLTFENGKPYAVSIRTVSGGVISVQTHHPGAGETRIISCTLPPAVSAQIGTGDLVVFGENDRHTADMVIHKIESAGPDLDVRLTLVDYAPEIFTAVSGNIPPYDSKITLPVDRESLPPPPPVIDRVVSDESVLLTGAGGSLVSRIVVSVSYPDMGSTIATRAIEVQYRRNKNGVQWTGLPGLPADAGQISISPVEDGEAYRIRLRSVSVYDVPSDWVEVMETVIGKTSPPPPVTIFNARIIDNQVELFWEHVAVADLKEYEIRYGTNWSTGTSLGRTAATTFRTPAQWFGDRTFFIKAVDTSGNESMDPTPTVVAIVAPLATFARSDVIDNNVLLYWALTPGSLPIVEVEIRVGPVFGTAAVIGRKKGTFTSVFESVSGEYKYWVAAIDSAGNMGPAASHTATVAQPPDYVLNRVWDADFINGTGAHVLTLADGSAIAPFATGETWQQHFLNNGMNTLRDFINAGYAYYPEPVPATAEYAEAFDYEATLGSSMITLDLDKSDFNGGPSVTRYIAEKALPADPWEEKQGGQIFGVNFRYVRDRFQFVSDGKKFSRLNRHTLRLDSKSKNDGGHAVVTDAVNGLSINFNTSFVDVQSIIVTPAAGGPAVSGIYDFVDVPNPVTFTAYLFDANGNKTTGKFSWSARGF